MARFSASFAPAILALLALAALSAGGAEKPAAFPPEKASSVIPAQAESHNPVMPARAETHNPVIPAPPVIPAQAGIQTRPQGRAADNVAFGGNAELPDAFSPEKASSVIPARAESHNPVIPARAETHNPVIPAPPVIPAQAGIQTRPQGRTANNAAFVGNAELPKPAAPESAAAGAATLDSRLRGNDGILGAAALDSCGVCPRENGGANDGIVNGGLAFGDYVRREQVRLLFALDNALSQKAEDVLLNEFAAVKKAQVQLQSKLGGRKGNIGINLIGALDDGESDSRAIGWQFRAYAGQQESKGINAGLFYRTISGGMLHGVNAFADYEDGDYGAFFRYGIGGEVRHSLVAFSANYYLPVTDERRVNNTVAAFSRKGYDAKLRLNAPDIERLRVAMDYYHFGGKGNTAKDSGFRYGVEVDILPALRLGVYHDSESEKFGGDIAYSHTFNSHSPSFLPPSSRGRAWQESITEFTPDLFAPVSREYSQRIALVTMRGAPPPLLFPINAVFTVGIEGVAATLALSSGVFGNLSSPGFVVRGNDILLSANSAGAHSLPLTITNAAHTLIATLTASAQNAPPIVGSFGGYHSRVFITGFFGTVGTIMANGGNGDLSYTPSGAGFVVENGGIVRFSVATAGTATATIVIDDANEQNPPVSILLTISAVAQCSFIQGCPALGHPQNQQTPPALPLATMLANAGANVNDDIRTGDNSRQGVISQYVVFRNFGGTNAGVTDIIAFLLGRGADINYSRVGGGGFAELTALDEYNNAFGSAAVVASIRAALVANGARCNRVCRIGDTDLAGQVCTRSTDLVSSGEGRDCRP